MSRWVSKNATGKAPAKAARHSPNAERCLEVENIYVFYVFQVNEEVILQLTSLTYKRDNTSVTNKINSKIQFLYIKHHILSIVKSPPFKKKKTKLSVSKKEDQNHKKTLSNPPTSLDISFAFLSFFASSF